MPRLELFLEPFVESLHSAEQQTNAQHYVQGLLSALGSKDVESIAYLHDRERRQSPSVQRAVHLHNANS